MLYLSFGTEYEVAVKYLCSSDINKQNLWSNWSSLNDYRHYYADIIKLCTDIIKLYIPALGKARKSILGSSIYKPNISITSRLSDFIECTRGLQFEHGLYITALEHSRILILSIHKDNL